MLSRAVNGFSASDVNDVINHVYGAPTYRVRAELIDRDGNKLRDLTGSLNIKDSKISHNARATDIRRSAQFSFIEALVSLGSWSSVVLSMSPLFFLRLGEPSGTTAQDASGNGHTGTYNGSPTLGAASLVAGDLTNTGVQTDGVNDNVQIGDAAWMDVTRISLVAHIKGSTLGSNQRIIARNAAAPNLCFIVEAVATTGYLNLTLSFDGTTPVFYATTAKISDGKPHQVIATYDGAFVKMYVDGYRVFKQAQTGNLAAVASDIRIGANTSATTFYTGVIDDVIMFGRGLTEAEVRALWQAYANDLRQIAFDRDYIRTFEAVKMFQNGTDGTPWAEWGTFTGKLSSPSRRATSSGLFRDCTSQDLTSFLQNDTFGSRYTISGGVNFITGTNAILAIAQSAGFDTSNWIIETTSKVTPSTYDFDINTSKLDAINFLLTAINYRPIRFTGDGRGVIQAYVLPENRATDDTFQTGPGCIIADDIAEDQQVDQATNDVVLARNNPDTTTIQSEQTNADVTSPISSPITTRRNLITGTVEAVDQTTLDALAQRALTLTGGATTRLKIQTAHRPFHDDEDKIRFVDQGLPNSLAKDVDCIEEEWELPLDPTQVMTHVLREIVRVT